MTDLTLYGCPQACSLVSHIALEATGAPFTYVHVDLFSGAQHAPGYLALNPRGKVPLLVAGEARVTETAAILSWLARAHPDARLLPTPQSDAWIAAMSDLLWFASGVHPLMTRLLVPARFTRDAACRADVRSLAAEALGKELALADARLEGRAWWMTEWSALDAYLFWIWARSGEGAIDLAPYANIARHADRMLARPQVRRALERERRHRPCFVHLENRPGEDAPSSPPASADAPDHAPPGSEPIETM